VHGLDSQTQFFMPSLLNHSSFSLSSVCSPL
jgi:hypothetical protein